MLCRDGFKVHLNHAVRLMLPYWGTPLKELALPVSYLSDVALDTNTLLCHLREAG